MWSGVPQGAVLGPVLFLIFINDIDSRVSSNVLKFADDTKVFSVIDSYVDGCGLQADLINIEKWVEMWQMEFNVDKCKVVGPYIMANTILDSSMICMGISYRK